MRHNFLKEQKGVMLILFACLLPFFLLCAGFAVDLGRGFVRRSQLQNAADAAALAGAAELGPSIMQGRESVDFHPAADRQAAQYVSANEGDRASSIDVALFQARNANNKGLYRVYLQTEVPTTFMRIVGRDSMRVAVNAVANIPATASAEAEFNQFIAFSGTMDGTFNTNNGTGKMGTNPWTGKPDLMDGQNQGNGNPISSTYDGYVGTTNEDFWNKHKDEYNKFWFFKGSTRGKSRKDAVASETNYTTLQLLKAEEYQKETEEIDKAIKTLFTNNPKAVTLSGSQNASIPSSATADYYLVSGEPGIGNMSLTLGNVPGDAGKPVYVYLTGNYDLININLSANVNRPIIFAYMGQRPSNPWWTPPTPNTEIHYNSDGHDYNGVIYTPYSDNKPFNQETGTFRGSLYSHDLVLNSNHGAFIFQKYAISSGSSGSSGTGGSTGGTAVPLKLVPDSEWNGG